MTRIIGSRRDPFAELATPLDPGPPLRLSRVKPADLGTLCACGQPTRGGAYGCDDCAGELQRFYGDVPWLVEQLDISVTRQRGKRTGAGGGEVLPWLDRAAIAQRRIAGLLDTTVRLCQAAHVRNQSPYQGPPTRGPVAASKWLLWRVDGLPHVRVFPDLLRASVHTERNVLHVIDCEPDLLYLGQCGNDGCDGAVFAFNGEDTGKCRACRATYDVDRRRAALFADLDDKLCTAAELAHLTTYLDLGVDRAKVRKLINQWHTRGVLEAKGHDAAGAPTFRYADAIGRLAATYGSKGA